LASHRACITPKTRTCAGGGGRGRTDVVGRGGASGGGRRGDVDDDVVVVVASTVDHVPRRVNNDGRNAARRKKRVRDLTRRAFGRASICREDTFLAGSSALLAAQPIAAVVRARARRAAV
jgi:hypothetical protein